jgi:hypothetical protein
MLAGVALVLRVFKPVTDLLHSRLSVCDSSFDYNVTHLIGFHHNSSLLLLFFSCQLFVLIRLDRRIPESVFIDFLSKIGVPRIKSRSVFSQSNRPIRRSSSFIGVFKIGWKNAFHVFTTEAPLGPGF